MRMLDTIKEQFKKLSAPVIEQVLWAEKNLKGKTGAEKKAAVIEKIDAMIPLPWFLEWADGPLIGMLVDLACEKLNWLTDYDFAGMELNETQTKELAESLNVSVASVANIETRSVSERLDALYEQYGVEKAAETEVKPSVATPETDAELARQRAIDENW